MYMRDEIEDETEPDPFFLTGIDPDDYGVDTDIPADHFHRSKQNAPAKIPTRT